MITGNTQDPLSLLLTLTILSSACSSTKKQASLAFIRHAFLKSSRRISDGYSFQGDELTKMIFKYDRGYELTQDDIEGFGCNSLNYDVPELNGDGYFSFTFSTTSFDQETGNSYNFLRPCKQNKDMTVHFAIYG